MATNKINNNNDMAKTFDAQAISTLEQEIAAQTEAFNQLRLSAAPSDQIDLAKKRLGELKKSLAVAKGAVGKERGKEKAKGKEEETAGRMLLKTAKVRLGFCQLLAGC